MNFNLLAHIGIEICCVSTRDSLNRDKLELQGIKAEGGMAEGFDSTRAGTQQLLRTPRSNKQEGSQKTRGSLYLLSSPFF